MKTRFLILIASITLSIVVTQAFALCIQNEDWPDAPCFDTLPVNRDEYRERWTPYYDYKGSEFMETKKVELLQAIKDGTFMEWEDSAENSNVYNYYHSVGLVPNQYEYFFFEDEAPYSQYRATQLGLVFVLVIAGSAVVGVFMVRRRKMKTNYKIIISGGILFVFGIYMMLNDTYRNYLFGIHPDLGIVGFLVSLSTGLVIAGIGIMLEFADRKYRVQK